MARTQIFDEISKDDYPANLTGNADANETKRKIRPQWMIQQMRQQWKV